MTKSPKLALVAAEPASLDELGREIIGLAGRLAAATCQWLLLVARFDAGEGHARMCLGSTARWLSHTCGMSRRTALDHVRVARALAAFPSLAEAMRAGRLSYSHVRAIARLARPGERRLVTDLIMVAEHGSVGQLETMVRGLRTVDHNASIDAGRPPPEYVRLGWTPESQWRIASRLAPERGALVESALKAVARADYVDQADALVRMAEICLAALADRDKPPRPLRDDERAAVVVHLNAVTLREDQSVADDNEESPARLDDLAATGDEGDATAGSAVPITMHPSTRRRALARLRNGPALPETVVRRLACASRVRAVLHDEHGDPAAVGRSRRLVTPRQYRALLLRDGGCRLPGCGSVDRLQAHHVWHWLDGGPTLLWNLMLLCERHHHAHHDGEFAITRAPAGQFDFTLPDGTPLPPHVDPADHVATAAPIAAEFDDVAADAATTRWNGDRLDRGWAVSVLAERRDWDSRAG